MKKILINDVTVRDGNQSLLATRMEHEDILKILRQLDEVGLHSIEVWGGATFDSALRFLKRNPWQNLREMKEAAPKTPLSMLLRGQNIVGYRHYDNDTLERFIRLTLENGIDIIRVFDALNDLDNIRNSIHFIKKYGGHCQGAISYTTSPVHNIDYYVKYVGEMVDLGIDSICIKDMSGILLPEVAYELISRLKKEFDLPINLHSHATTGLSTLVFEQAMLAGVDIVDGCIAPFANGTSHIALETLLEIAKLNQFEVAFDMEKLSPVYDVAQEVANKYIEKGLYNTKTLIINPKILTYQVPGGMLSNLMSQLKDLKATDRYVEVLEEIPHVRKDLGYPPLVTPLSQMVGTQAVFNVLSGQRYKMVPKEIKDYAKGQYGKFPGSVNEELFETILKEDTNKELMSIDERPSVFEEKKAELTTKIQREPREEEVISYILFPQSAILDSIIEFEIFDRSDA